MRKRITKVIFVTFSIIGLTIFLYQRHYYRELRQIKNEINSLDGVRVLKITGNHDLTLEEISALIEIDGKGVLHVFNLKPNYELTFPISIYQIDNYKFYEWTCEVYSTCKDFKGSGGSLTLGQMGIDQYRLDKPIKNLKDLINSYDQILELVERMPKFPEWEYFKLQTAWDNEKEKARTVYTIQEEADTNSRFYQWYNKVYNISWSNPCCNEEKK
jgi:hypothetical protein